MRVLVTGATGFVGGAVVRQLALQGLGLCRGSTRRAGAHLPVGADLTLVEELTDKTDWRVALRDMDAVVHTAARVHVMRDTVSDPLAEFRRVNVAGTLRLAQQAVETGVRRFIFISSIKVNGESTERGRPFRADDIPAPLDPYGISKYEAEQGLFHVARETGLEVVVIRPVLVYGPGVRANFFAMMRWLDCGIPLPLGAIHNARSLVALDNLVDLIATCLRHPAAANQTFLVSDGEDLSTTALLHRMAIALNTSARLFPVSAALLQRVARMLRKKDVARRLCDSLQVDITKTRQLLGWEPVVSVDTALRQTAQYFLQSKI